MGKVYRSKKGRRFAITKIPKPMEMIDGGEVVFLTQRIFDWCKEQNLDADQFEMIWLMIRDDYRYDPIPQDEMENKGSMAQRYCSEIKNTLLRGKGKTA